MSNEDVSNNYMGSFIFSLIGGIMILVGEFAGWYYESGSASYGYYREWGSVTAFSEAFIILVPIGVGMLYVAIKSYQATQEEPTVEQLDLMYKISRATLIAILAGALLFVILISEDDYWWFGEGFYGGVVGSLISVLLLKNAMNKRLEHE